MHQCVILIYEKCVYLLPIVSCISARFFFMLTQMQICVMCKCMCKVFIFLTLSTDMVHGVQEKLQHQQTIHIALSELPIMRE